MTTLQMASKESFSKLLKHASSALKLSYQEIRDNYAAYPICLIQHIEKEGCEKVIKIHFDEEKASLKCSFNDNGNCTVTSLYPDNGYVAQKFIEFLTEYHEYDFIKSRFILSDCYLKIEELEDKVYFTFYL